MKAYKITTQKSWAATHSDLKYTLGLWGVTEWNVTHPKGVYSEAANQSEEDRTVTITFTKDGKRIVYTSKDQSRAVDNLRKIYLGLEAMRMNDRRGLTEMLTKTYLALGAPEQQIDPYQVLGIYNDAPLEVAEAVYKTKVMKAHPDKGGDIATFKKLKTAIEMIRSQKNG
jgi:hypothetical protein